MTVTLVPYLNFQGTAAEAMEHYRSVLGGELEVDTHASFAQSTGGELMVPPEQADLVMHAQLTTPFGFQVMAADVPADMPHTPGSSVQISLVGDAEDKEALTAAFHALAEGGEATQPLEEAPWGASFGMVTDRYGIGWMFNIG
ncbi:VOC family protein [Georgenia sp. Z1491]|uniref:VOC family protein n=1 Tax=Georgenia sp. Z1491 TaxID=3416707 RepID=UPI003CF2529A